MIYSPLNCKDITVKINSKVLGKVKKLEIKINSPVYKIMEIFNSVAIDTVEKLKEYIITMEIEKSSDLNIMELKNFKLEVLEQNKKTEFIKCMCIKIIEEYDPNKGVLQKITILAVDKV